MIVCVYTYVVNIETSFVQHAINRVNQAQKIIDHNK